MTIRIARVLTAAVAVSSMAGASDAAPKRHALDEIVLPMTALPSVCKADETAHAVSVQATTFYSEKYDEQIARVKSVARQAQPIRCGENAGVIYYYEYATKEDVRTVLAFLKPFIWGEKGPTSLHPEIIDTWDNIIVITSFRNPAPVAGTVMSRVGVKSTGGGSDGGLPREAQRAYEKAKKAYFAKDYKGAEKQFRSLATTMPDLQFAHLYLGHSLFYQHKYAESIPPYEKARALAAAEGRTGKQDERILNDQLGMAYGLSGRLDDARKHFEEAARKDPDYPLYYYNLACVAAEQGDLDRTLANLKLAYEHKANFLPGESYPNPREDDSFKKYLGDPKFEAVVKELGF